MKPTQRLDATRNIKKRIVSFFSLCLVVTLGIGGAFTTHYMAGALSRDGAYYYDETHFKDYEFVSSVGLTEEDIETVSKEEGVGDVEGAHSFTGSLSNGKEKMSVQILTRTEKVSVPRLVDGELPTGPQECLIGEDLAEEKGLSIGDEINLYTTDPSIEKELLKNHRFRITGTMAHPDYLRRHVTYCVVVPPSAIDEEVLHGAYTRIFVRMDRENDTEALRRGGGEEAEKELARFTELATTLEKTETNRVQDIANKTIDEEWAKVEKQLKDGEAKLEDGRVQLEEGLAKGQQELDDAQAKLEQALQELLAAEQQIKDGEEQLARAKEELESVKSRLAQYGFTPQQALEILDRILPPAERFANTMTQFSENDPEVKTAKENFLWVIDGFKGTDVEQIILNETGLKLSDITEDTLTLAFINRYTTALRNLRNRLQEAVDAEAMIPQKEQELADAKAKLEAGWQEYDAGLAQLEQGRITFERERALKTQQWQAAAVLLAMKKAQAEIELDKARDEADNLVAHVVVQDRNCNGGYIDLQSNIHAMSSAGLAFGFLFLLVSALVCFSTLAIIIEEQKRLVGATKAFGFRNNEILKKYLVFGVTGAAIGGLLGMGFAYLLSGVSLNVISSTNMYQFGSHHGEVALLPTVIATLGAMLLCALVTVLACMGLLRSPASMLMQGNTLRKSKVEGRRKHNAGGSGGKSLYSRLIARNMRDDLARVVLTVVIIAGSCFLVGLGFSLRTAFHGMFDHAMDDVYAYDTRVDLSTAVTEEDRQEMEDFLKEQGVSFSSATYEPHLYRENGQARAIFILASEPEEMENIFTLRDPDTQEVFPLPEEGVLVQNRLMETLGYDKGSTIELYSNTLTLHEGEVVGTFQNYQGRVVAMSDATYEKLFREEPKNNRIFLVYNDADEETVKEGLMAINDGIGFEEEDAFVMRFQGVSLVYDEVVIIMSGISILMSFMILLNLCNIFVSRKKKEIIVMRINGFSQKQAVGYLARETIFTTVLGLVLAFIMGMVFTEVVIRLLEQPDVQFIREPNIPVWLLACLVESVFAVVIYYLSFRRIKNFALREIAEL